MASASAVNNACVGSIWETMGLLSIFASALTDCLVSVVAECEESVSKALKYWEWQDMYAVPAALVVLLFGRITQ